MKQMPGEEKRREEETRKAYRGRVFYNHEGGIKTQIDVERTMVRTKEGTQDQERQDR